eukprot:TRINITY_DN6104_c0_g1_i1.p1 TRINITY_DN6104_c0_g1~~TRINITY_DN6104_c0_g1_i1.p1  ORF type:complete len:582 (+),score=120.97 TRINITY_DN6104_c0_g1_i1:389-2134(+)
MGIPVDNDDIMSDVVRYVCLTAEALKYLFPCPALVATDILGTSGNISKRILVEEVRITIFPLGVAILMFQINWNVKSSEKTTTDEPEPEPEQQQQNPSKTFNDLDDGNNNNYISLQQLRNWLFLSKFRHKVENVFEGWILNDESSSTSNEIQSKEDELGVISDSLHHRTPISITTLGNWLLDGEQSFWSVDLKLSLNEKRTYHHTLAVVDRELKPEHLAEYLYHLERAFAQNNRAPPLLNKNKITTQSKEHTIIRLRQNRYLGMSREGTISLSWPSSTLKSTGITGDFEVQKWYKVFLGIYLLLAVHVQGEKAILLELSNMSSNSAELLKIIAKKGENSLGDIVKIRNDLFSMAVMMTRYTIQMGSHDCGGLSDYVEFFSSLRSIFRIRQRRHELRADIQDVLALVESSYLEEQRKYTEVERILAQDDKRVKYEIEKKKFQHQSRFERWVGVVSIMFLPIVVISGIMGMNLDDIPHDLPFYPTLGVIFGVSILLLVIFGCMSMEKETLVQTPYSNMSPIEILKEVEMTMMADHNDENMVDLDKDDRETHVDHPTHQVILLTDDEDSGDDQDTKMDSYDSYH